MTRRSREVTSAVSLAFMRPVFNWPISVVACVNCLALNSCTKTKDKETEQWTGTSQTGSANPSNFLRQSEWITCFISRHISWSESLNKQIRSGVSEVWHQVAASQNLFFLVVVGYRVTQFWLKSIWTIRMDCSASSHANVGTVRAKYPQKMSNPNWLNIWSHQDIWVTFGRQRWAGFW